MQITHPIPPFFDENSETLILGSFPSVKSRESGFFYGHPQNRFWKVCAAVFGENAPTGIAEKKAFLKAHRIALWDVIAACEITGSADASIQNVIPNDLSGIFRAANIQRIFVNGKKAAALYEKYQKNSCGRSAVTLPSTSPANAAWRFERLCDAWRIINEQKGTNV